MNLRRLHGFEAYRHDPIRVLLLSTAKGIIDLVAYVDRGGGVLRGNDHEKVASVDGGDHGLVPFVADLDRCRGKKGIEAMLLQSRHDKTMNLLNICARVADEDSWAPQ